MKETKPYRINGFEQIKAFYSWVFNNPDKARPTHVSLYLFLWNQANRANWVEWFKCPYDLAMQGACIGNNGTYYKCLDELKEWKLIDYQKGVNNFKAPLIHLIQLCDSEQLSEQVTVPLSEQLSVQQTVQLPEQLPVHKYKLLTNNIKLITDNLEEVLKFLDDKPESVSKEQELFDLFRKKYPGTKRGVETEFDNFKKKHKDWKEVLPLLSTIIDTQITSREQRKANKEFVPEWKNLQTWINQRCWEEEFTKALSISDQINNLKA